jgi:hypothetical protein
LKNFCRAAEFGGIQNHIVDFPSSRPAANTESLLGSRRFVPERKASRQLKKAARFLREYKARPFQSGRIFASKKRPS